MGELVAFLWEHVVVSIVLAFSVMSAALGFAEQAQAITTRFKAWQLQALGMGFFFIAVVLVLVSYGKERARAPAIERADTMNIPQHSRKILLPASSPDPNILPENIAVEYVALVSQRGTTLHEQIFLEKYAGKYMDLSLKLASMERTEDHVKAQFYAGQNPDVFATFSSKWELYLASKNVGDIIYFRAKILDAGGSRYQLGEARPL